MKLISMALALLAIPVWRPAAREFAGHRGGGRTPSSSGRKGSRAPNRVPDRADIAGPLAPAVRMTASNLCWDEPAGLFCLSLVDAPVTEQGTASRDAPRCRTVARLARTIGPYVAFCDSPPLGSREEGETVRIVGPRLFNLFGEPVVPLCVNRPGGSEVILLKIDPSLCEIELERVAPQASDRFLARIGATSSAAA